MKKYLVLILLVCVTGSTYGAGTAHATHKIRTQGYLDSLMRVESINASNDPTTWDLNKKLGMANFILQDEWAWSKLLDTGTTDTGHNFTVTLVGQHDRQVGIAEFRAAFAADLARADTLLYNFRVLCAAKENHPKSHTVLFERAYETAYGHNPNGASIVAR